MLEPSCRSFNKLLFISLLIKHWITISLNTTKNWNVTCPKHYWKQNGNWKVTNNTEAWDCDKSSLNSIPCVRFTNGMCWRESADVGRHWDQLIWRGLRLSFTLLTFWTLCSICRMKLLPLLLWLHVLQGCVEGYTLRMCVYVYTQKSGIISFL